MSNRSETAILLLSCEDQRGIVAEISHFIFMYNGNIIHSDQHNDLETNTFFMRIEWEIENFAIDKDKIYQAFEPLAERFNMSWQLRFSSDRVKMAVFVSRLDHCLYELLLGNRSGEVEADIDLIISNHPDLKQVAEYFNIPFYHFPVNKENKKEVEKEELELLKKHNIDLVVLARYMQILTSDFTRQYENNIINIHHSFLPAFVGAKPYHQAYARGVKIIGATSHYVTADLDQGPIIEQDVARISHRDAVSNLKQKGKNLEKIVLSHAVRLHTEHKIIVSGNKTVIFD